MPARLEIATPDDAPAIASLLVATAQHLTSVHGVGPWSRNTTERGVLFNMRNAAVYVLRRRNKVIATLTLATKKPWAIDRKYFNDSRRPLYLTSMAVAPDLQRQGIGGLCIEEAVKVVKNWPGDAIRLDAYNAEAGAGEFYRKCGFREVGRASYRNVPLIYFEMAM
jgi:ribosomal protein S18 acetylase RimI-like enzyme